MKEWIKALHVIAIIAWMAGMLYLPPLFVCNCDAEAGSKQSKTREDTMPTNHLKLVGVQVERSTQEDLAAGGTRARLNVAVEVENQTTAPLHVWASERGYDYDPTSKVLTLHLSEQPLVLPPGIIMLSDHPRAPAQVEVAANGRAKIRVQLPAVVRRPAGSGVGWVEDPIGEIARVDVDVQYGTTPVEGARQHETSAEFRSRMREHGEVVRGKLTPSSGGETPRQKEK